MNARALIRHLAPAPVAYRWRRARNRIDDLRPTVRTIHRVPPGNEPPAPREFAAFGEGTWVVPPARVRGAERIRIGAGTVVMENSILWAVDDAGTIGIGDGVTLARFNTVISAVEVVIEDGVASSDSVTIFDTWDHPLRPVTADAPRYEEAAPVVIEAGAYLAFNSIIGPGVRIGRHAYVGEGSVVLDDVPPHTVVYGNPAVVVRRYEPESGNWEGQPWP